MGGSSELKGPDFAQGVADAELGDGRMLLGHAEGEAVLLAKRGKDVFAVGATCTHYGGPLSEGLMVGNTVRCPWHHACFDLRTGEAARAPALNALTCWNVERRGDRLFVLGKAKPRAAAPRSGAALSSVVILGGGAAGQAAAEMLRREGYEGKITMLSADAAPPCDRPNLSKDYLAGTAPEEWIPLRPSEFFREQRIDLVLGARATRIDVAKKRVEVGSETHAFDALLLATGAEPLKLTIPGAELPHVHYLRTLADKDLRRPGAVPGLVFLLGDVLVEVVKPRAFAGDDQGVGHHARAGLVGEVLADDRLVDHDAIGDIQEGPAGEESCVEGSETVAVCVHKGEEPRLHQLWVLLGGFAERLQDDAFWESLRQDQLLSVEVLEPGELVGVEPADVGPPPLLVGAGRSRKPLVRLQRLAADVSQPARLALELVQGLRIDRHL
jgi:nitrite reductase/ring-hydroxylating ferredoxin subunit